jgi:hypothetical protein
MRETVTNANAPAEAPAPLSRPSDGEIDTDTVVFIYVPGLAEPAASADAFAKHIATAVDEEASNPMAIYKVQPAAPKPGEASAGPAARDIVRVCDGKSRVATRVYRMEYENDLCEPFAKASLITRAFLLLLVVARTGPRVLAAVLRRKRRRRKSAKATAELLFIVGVFIFLILSCVLLFVALGEAILSRRHSLGALQWGALGATGAATFLPAKVRDGVAKAGADYYAASSYLSSGDKRSELERVLGPPGTRRAGHG